HSPHDDADVHGIQPWRRVALRWATDPRRDAVSRRGRAVWLASGSPGSRRDDWSDRRGSRQRFAATGTTDLSRPIPIGGSAPGPATGRRERRPGWAEFGTLRALFGSFDGLGADAPHEHHPGAPARAHVRALTDVDARDRSGWRRGRWPDPANHWTFTAPGA